MDIYDKFVFVGEIYCDGCVVLFVIIMYVCLLIWFKYNLILFVLFLLVRDLQFISLEKELDGCLFSVVFRLVSYRFVVIFLWINIEIFNIYIFRVFVCENIMN